MRRFQSVRDFEVKKFCATLYHRQTTVILLSNGELNGHHCWTLRKSVCLAIQHFFKWPPRMMCEWLNSLSNKENLKKRKITLDRWPESAFWFCTSRRRGKNVVGTIDSINLFLFWLFLNFSVWKKKWHLRKTLTHSLWFGYIYLNCLIITQCVSSPF